MRAIVLIILSAAALAACTPESGDFTGSIGICTRQLYSAYNPKDMKQCVKVCIACESGVMTTCSTSCTLKGAH